MVCKPSCDQLRANLKAPVLGLFDDASIPAGTVEEFDKLFNEISVKYKVVMYSNSGHAFFRDSDASNYTPKASKGARE